MQRKLLSVAVAAFVIAGAAAVVAIAQDMPAAPSSAAAPSLPAKPAAAPSPAAKPAAAAGVPQPPTQAPVSHVTANPSAATASVAAPPAAAPPAAAPPAATPLAASTAPANRPPAGQPLSAAQLDQLLAPVALYPDPVLGQVLMASTYPLEIIEAARWVRVPADAALKGDALTAALKAKNWAPAVMALVPFPRLLALMADQIEWTEQLGNAFLAQQADVMGAVQRLRHEAMAAGNLKATPECHCVIRTSGATIAILPIETEQVCLPVYNPTLAYGAWPEPQYPPDLFPVPEGLALEPGVAIAFYPPIELAAFGPLWGWGSIDWHDRQIVVDRAHYVAADPGRPAFAGDIWAHDPAHRGGVAYRDPAVSARFGAARIAGMTAAGRTALGAGSVTPGRMALGRERSGGPVVSRHEESIAGAAAMREAPRGRGGHAGGLARGSGRVLRGAGSVGHAAFVGPHGGGPRGGPHGGGHRR